jgi:hypothetical protein
MKTLQFEAVKMALKQDKNGYALTLSVHPDMVPEELLRDFVGSRYQVVMVRVSEDERPMNREQDLSRDYVRMAAILCRDSRFQNFLVESGQLFDADEQLAVDWLKNELNVKSRKDIQDQPQAQSRLMSIKQEFESWTND